MSQPSSIHVYAENDSGIIVGFRIFTDMEQADQYAAELEALPYRRVYVTAPLRVRECKRPTGLELNVAPSGGGHESQAGEGTTAKAKAADILDLSWRPDWSWMSTPSDKRKKNDCAIIALQHATGLTYKESHLLCYQHGWCSTFGLVRGWLEQILTEVQNQATQWRHDLCSRHGCTLASIDFPEEGVFLVYTDNHVSVVVNGQIYNQDSMYDHVYEVWEVGPPGSHDQSGNSGE